MRSFALRFSTLNALLLSTLTLGVVGNGGCSTDDTASAPADVISPRADASGTAPGDASTSDASSAPGFVQGALVQMSTDSTLPSGCGEPAVGNTNYTNTNLEPSIAVDPTNDQHLVAAWQQNRWSASGSEALVTAYSMDGGLTWKPGGALAFSKCTGGSFQRVTHARVAFSVNGDVFVSAMGIDVAGSGDAGALGATGMMVTRSTDGGKTWSTPTLLQKDVGDTVDFLGLYDDFENLTTDPSNGKYAYATWVQQNNLDPSTCPESDYYGAVYFSRTTNAEDPAGATWSTPKKIFDGGLDTEATANHVLVTGTSGQLVDMFVYYQDWANASDPPNCGGAAAKSVQIGLVSSSDYGETWSGLPTFVDVVNIVPGLSASVTNVDGGTLPINDASWAAAFGSDPAQGKLYAAWQDTRFATPAAPADAAPPETPANASDIAFTMSSDGGKTWSTTIKVNAPKSVSAFLPSVAVSNTGRVVIRYYDLRNDTAPSTKLMASEWVTYCDGSCTSATSWKEFQNRPDFDVATAPGAASGSSSGLLLGNFESVIAFGNNIVTASTATTGVPNLDETFARKTFVRP